MYKTALILVTVILFGVTTPLYAAQYDYEPFYIGVGGSYSIENFQEGLDPDNAWGFNAKLGYRFHKYVALQFDYDYLSGFDESQKAGFTIGGDTFDVAGKYEVDVQTFMLSLKGYFGIDPYGIRPFVIVGGGVMHADADVKLSVAAPGISMKTHSSTDETDGCVKLGAGLDWFLGENVSLGLEGSYVWGLGDLDDLQYFNIGVGVAYHFGSSSELARQLRLEPKK